MQGAKSADLLGAGAHCAHPDCNQIDFLPFVCDCCKLTFCLQHRTYDTHNCTQSGSRACNTLICPICARGFKVIGFQSPDEAFEIHCRTECRPENYDKVNNKKKCPVKGCKEKLGSSNTYKCKECQLSVCLKHRFPADHQCIGKKAAQQKARQAAFKSNINKFLGQGSQSTSISQQDRQDSLQDIGNQIKAGFEKIGKFFGGQTSSKSSNPKPNTSATRAPTLQYQQQPNQSHISASQSAFGRVNPQQSHNGAQGQRQSQQREVCTQCGKSFPNINSLIQHAQTEHQTQQSENREQCPHCAASFSDPVDLVEHVEKQHSRVSGLVNAVPAG